MFFTRRFLKTKDNILISRADKGNSTVILYKEEYFSQMTLMFSDHNLNKIISKDPTISVENKCNKLINKLCYLDCITKFESLNMKKHNSVCPKAYGLRKTHKENKIAYRPVISNIDAATYKLSVYIHKILSLVCSVFDKSVKSPFEAATILQKC